MGVGVDLRLSLLRVDRRGGVLPSTPEEKRVDRWVGATRGKVGEVDMFQSNQVLKDSTLVPKGENMCGTWVLCGLHWRVPTPKAGDHVLLSVLMAG